MRNVSQIRERAAAALHAMLTRPGMYGIGQGFEHTVRSQLFDLAFIDEQDDRLQGAFAALEGDGLFSAFGTWGAVVGALGQGDFTDELASIYARVAAQLGYFQPERRLSEREWREAQSVESWARESVRVRADVEARFGVPSYQRDGQSPHVLGYAGPNDEQWLYFDFAQGVRGELRSLRLPIAPFVKSVIHLAPRVSSTPEETYRRFLIAMVEADEEELRRHAVLHGDISALCTSAYPRDVATLLSDQYRSMEVLRISPPGEVVYLVSDGCPVPMRLVEDGSTWRVDADPLILMQSRQSTITSGACPTSCA